MRDFFGDVPFDTTKVQGILGLYMETFYKKVTRKKGFISKGYYVFLI